MYSPFANDQEWELAQWLSRRVGQKGIDEYLKLSMVSTVIEFNQLLSKEIQVKNTGCLSFHNTYSYLKKVDQLPTGPEWQCEVITAQGDIMDENGTCLEEYLELWFRDPVECVRELLSNPAFVEFVLYAPERVYSDSEGKERIYDEMWSADWWWEMQVHQSYPVWK